MKRKLVLALSLLAALLCACGSDDAPASSPPVSSRTEAASLDVMYVPVGEGALYFEQGSGTESALTLQLPKDLLDENGEPIMQEDLNRGDVLRLYFSQPCEIGETWPGQLFTEADRAQVLRRGRPEDADKYQDAVDAFYHPDPLRIPYLQFTHIEGIAACGGSMDPETESYEWDCTDETGEPVHLSRQADHPLLREDLSQLSFSGPAPLELQVEKNVLEWEVRRWDASQKGEESLPEGELVTLTPGSVAGEGVEPAGEPSDPPLRAVAEDAAPGQVYQVTARWEQGWVSYAFEIVSAPSLEAPEADGEEEAASVPASQ